MGELLGEMEKQGPSEYQRLHDETVAPSLKDIGLEGYKVGIPAFSGKFLKAIFD
jgi:hypothetical protein